MFMTLAAVVVALALGHMAPALASSLRQSAWFGRWLRWVDARFPEDGFWRGRYGIAFALLPPLALVAVFQHALADGPLLQLPALLFGIAALFLAWGPRDLDVDVDAVMDAADPGERAAAAARLHAPGEAVALDGPSLVGAVFRSAQRRWFGVLFWFLLLGAFGAVLYRLAALAAEDEAASLPPDTLAGARGLLALLDWPVAQLMAWSLALVGDFDAVLAAWKEHGGASFAPEAGFLAAAARASVRSELMEDAADEAGSGAAPARMLPVPFAPLSELRDAMALVWRILLVWLAVLALFVVAGWVG